MEISVLFGEELGENCYLVMGKEENVVIDPGFDILEELEKRKLKIDKILLTHGHFDHIAGVKKLQEKHAARVYLHEADAQFPAHAELNLSQYAGIACPVFPVDEKLRDGEEILAGELCFTVLHTPGHTPGSVCYRCGKVLFTGDMLFRDSIGRTDLPTGDRMAMKQSCGKLAAIEENLEVLPGHGPTTSLQREKKNNLYLRNL